MVNDEIVQLKSYNDKTGQEIGNVFPITNHEAVKVEHNQNLKEKLTEITEQIEQTNASLDSIANNGTTVAVLERVIKEEIDRQIKDGTISNMTIVDGQITSAKIADGSIKPKHLASETNIGVVHVGTTTPPPTAKLWVITPTTDDILPPSEEDDDIVPPSDDDDILPPFSGDFINDKLLVYIDGDNGISAETIPNNGSVGGVFWVDKKEGYESSTVTVSNKRYTIQPGAVARAKFIDKFVQTLEGTDITIMIRAKIFETIDAPLTSESTLCSVGCSPTWIGFYIKPFKENGIKLNVDATPHGVIKPSATHTDLKGKDIIITIRKTSSTVDLFINENKVNSSPHVHDVISTWKSNVNNFSIAMSHSNVGSLLVYNKALSDSEIKTNIDVEKSIRGELSQIDLLTILDEAISMEGDIND